MKAVAETIPNSGEFHLPSDLDVKTLHTAYCFRYSRRDPAPYNVFCARLKSHHNNLKIARFNTLGSCDYCNDFAADSAGIRQRSMLTPHRLKEKQEHQAAQVTL